MAYTWFELIFRRVMSIVVVIFVHLVAEHADDFRYAVKSAIYTLLSSSNTRNSSMSILFSLIFSLLSRARFDRFLSDKIHIFPFVLQIVADRDSAVSRRFTFWAIVACDETPPWLHDYSFFSSIYKYNIFQNSLSCPLFFFINKCKIRHRCINITFFHHE
jgi:hypothetical protein